jgi:hypothetical protein
MYTKWPQNTQSDRKTDKMTIKYVYQHLPLQDPPKFTQTGNFWFENMPSGNPGHTYLCTNVCEITVYKPTPEAGFKIHINFVMPVLAVLAALLPDFSRYKIPKRGKIYQMTTKYTKWP